ncbi:MAG: methyltransferase domain-containing protein [candidate division Zixibacteria bacterium]|nr:methyltransferase domain-containing protein [candidate division Zixibacteria bacterium]MDH3937998.1 methyltransferase domain-containing protein [candidate division Zixibacteria bacterium]MDH4034272.1 methyltransferase domain-containing protein [candidate division Zixibacteria bacterium]
MKTHSFNQVAADYSQKVAPYRFSQFLTLIHELDLFGDEKVLDIGSGPGELSMEIAKRLADGGFLQGVDLSPQMIELASRIAEQQKRKNVAFAAGDALDLEFEENSFDVVVSSNAFPWVPDRQKFLNEVLRVLRPGGRLGLVALSSRCYQEFFHAFARVAASNPDLFPQERPHDSMGARLHTPKELSELVEEAGLKVIKRFSASTEEPIDAAGYVERVNAIVGENYLDHLNNNGAQTKARALILDALKSKVDLNITESSAFVLARKPGWDINYQI